MEAKKFFFRNFFGSFQNLDALYRPLAGKLLVLKDLCLGMGTSVASAVTLIKRNYASVRQSRDSLYRDRHNVTKKVAAAPCSETARAEKLNKFTETCFLAHYYACEFGLNRLSISTEIFAKNRYNGQVGNCNVSAEADTIKIFV